MAVIKDKILVIEDEKSILGVHKYKSFVLSGFLPI